MKFSILIPVYNVEKYLERCVKSILAQTYINFEVILVDDGSTDRSSILCDTFQNLDNRIKVFHKENKGQLHTREYAISKATGDYYVFLDSDDWLDKEALETFYKYISDTNCDCLVFGYKKVDKNGKILSISVDEKEHGQLLDREQSSKKLLSGFYNAIWRKVVRCGLIGKKDLSKFYVIRIGEDVIESIEILETAKTYVFINDRMYNYYFHTDSVIHLADNKKLNDTIVYLEEIAQFIKREQNFSDECKVGVIRRIANDVIGIIIMAFHFYGMNSYVDDIFENVIQSSFYQSFFKNGLFTYVTGIRRKVVAKLFDWHLYGLLYRMVRIWDNLKVIRKGFNL